MAKHKDILNDMAVNDLVPQDARASAAMEQYTLDASINQVYTLIDIF